jgi:hypothetical protein
MVYKKQKGSDLTIKSRFVNDLLLNLSVGKSFDTGLSVGFGLTLGDITNNLTPYHSPTYFSGVYLQYQPNGSVLLKAMKAKGETNDKVLSKTFSINKYGIEKAFKEAVKVRADYCGYEGTLPLDNLTVPSVEALIEHAVKAKSAQWVLEHKISDLFNNNL